MRVIYLPLAFQVQVTAQVKIFKTAGEENSGVWMGLFTAQALFPVRPGRPALFPFHIVKMGTACLRAGVPKMTM